MIKRSDPDDVVDPAGGEWHIDKRVPVALIVTLLFQAAVGLIWATRLEARVGYLEQNYAQARIIADEDHERLIRIDARVATLAGQDPPAQRR